MTGSSSIDISVANVWRSYTVFRQGKKPSPAILKFEDLLLDNILALARDLQNGEYKHGPYDHMIVNDTKRRDIAVAHVRDRVVHRMLYDYLVPIWDKTLIYDAWSCRHDKGLYGAIDRAQLFAGKYRDDWLWRADITKFFDSVSKDKIRQLTRNRIDDPLALWLLDEVTESYSSFHARRGMPIGNLTSQILANVYLNEFDRFMRHSLKPYAYLRYGDDWLCFARDKESLERIRRESRRFLREELCLNIHPDVDVLQPVRRGISYLGVDLWPTGRRINRAARVKIGSNLAERNAASYKSLLLHHQSEKHINDFDWMMLERFE